MDSITLIKNEISDYLEKKYGEKFNIAQLVSGNGELDIVNKVYVYPESRENDWFTVCIEFDDETEAVSFKDGYRFIFAERAILPFYQALVSKEFPNAKVTIQIKNELGITRSENSKDISFNEFTETEKPFAIKVNVFLSDDVLAKKNKIFDGLAQVIENTPNKGCFHDYKIMFVKTKQFDEFNASKCKGFELSEYKMRVEEVIAHTSILIPENEMPEKINELLKFNFCDVSDFNIDSFLTHLMGGKKDD